MYIYNFINNKIYDGALKTSLGEKWKEETKRKCHVCLQTGKIDRRDLLQ